MTSSQAANYQGARGSNAGDQFHEFWALEQVLQVLEPNTSLKAVTVEGVISETAGPNDPAWDGVDCGLFFGGDTLESADEVHLSQLKYSSADYDKAWTVTRVTTSTAATTNNSVIRRLAAAYKKARNGIKAGALIKVRLVTNQPIADGLRNALSSRWSGKIAKANLDHKIAKDLETLKEASGLTEALFPEFVSAIDLSGVGQASRFATEAKVVALVAQSLGDDVSPEVGELLRHIRQMMLPEAHRDVINEHVLLTWFGLGSREGLFPAPADIVPPVKRIPRAVAPEIVGSLASGERLVLVQGDGGCGKTTLMREISELLPAGSVSQLFDCFGGGRCVHSDDKRHLPENAFLQLTNDLALQMGLPTFIPRNNKHPATIRTFMTKLRIAGEALKIRAPGALLVVQVDAADNSVTAAIQNDEHPFVFDLARADLGSLPENVRVIVSARKSRADSLKLPGETKKFTCPPFTWDETKRNLEAAFGDVSDDYVEQFHELTDHNPRVQAYAIAGAAGDRGKAIALLLPGGKELDDVLRSTFTQALKKHGQEESFDKIVAALAYLPAPATLSAVAQLADTTVEIVKDFVSDLPNGLRLSAEGITIADEDFDAFIRDKSKHVAAKTKQAIADQFLASYKADAYSSLHLADALVQAGREEELLGIIQEDPQPAAISDPIVRRQVQLSRLKLSLAACRKAGSPVDALKTVLISAEAEGDESKLTQLMFSELDLSVDFGGASLRRTILLDRDLVHRHGSFLAHEACSAARSGNSVQARSSLFAYNAWMARRRRVPSNERENWHVDDSDIAARTEALLVLDGAKAAVADLLCWSPRNVPIRVACRLIPALIAAGRIAEVSAIHDAVSDKEPWNLTVAVPLASAGQPVDVSALERSLRRLRRRFVPGTNLISSTSDGSEWGRKLLSNFVTACELAYLNRADPAVIVRALDTMLGLHAAPGSRQFFRFETLRFDVVVRCWLLKEVLEDRVPSVDAFVAFVRGLAPEPKKPKKKSDSKDRSDRDAKREEERRDGVIKILFPIYSARLDILTTARGGQRVAEDQIRSLGKITRDTYSFDNEHESIALRDTAAASIMSLLIVPTLDASDLAQEANKVVSSRFADPFGTRKIPILKAMLSRGTSAASVVQSAAEAALEVKKAAVSASDKVEMFIRFARLVHPVSQADARSFFDDAVDIAKEIDSEAIDQIAFLAQCTKAATQADFVDARRIASQIHVYVTAASERLDSDGFPWFSGISAMTRLDTPFAMAAVSNWADSGRRRLSWSLDPLLYTAAKEGAVHAATATALQLLIENPDDNRTFNRLVKQAASDAHTGKLLLDELSRQALLLNSGPNRSELIALIAETQCRDPQPDGPWLSELRRMSEYMGTLPKPKTEQDTEYRRKKDDGEAEEPKQYEFDPAGKAFATTEAIVGVLQAAEASGLRFSEAELLVKMRDASSAPAHRAAFLSALAGVPEDLGWFTGRARFICETVKAWSNSPSVVDWAKKKIPVFVVEQFHGTTLYIKEGSSVLTQLLDCADLDPPGRQRAIFEGLSRSGTEFSSRTLFGLADMLVLTFGSKDASEILSWYAQRLYDRLPADAAKPLPLEDIPNSTSSGVGRLLFAQMTDIDTQVRWRAAHALRHLGLLGCNEEVSACLGEHAREADPAFRLADAPFYHLAGKLWLVMTVYRLSAELPAAVSNFKSELFAMATSTQLPHVAIREYAKRSLLQLASQGSITLSPTEATAIAVANVPAVAVRVEDRTYGRSFQSDREGVRFKYDELDTLRYWYTDILSIFPRAQPLDVLNITDRWIIDVWRAEPEAGYWDKEPRKGRYDENRYLRYHHGHGHMPRIERHARYLEWHAMQCAIGEMLTSQPVSSETGYGSYESWRDEWMPTAPPGWISDHRSPTPLDRRFWVEDPRTDAGWLRNFRRDEFLSYLLCDGEIITAAVDTSRFVKREERVHIDSALVEPSTASALARAVESGEQHYFHLPFEGDDEKFEDSPFVLKGWLSAGQSERQFDDRDPHRYEVDPVERVPGQAITTAQGLACVPGTRPSWVGEDGSKPLTYEAWCDEPSPEDERYSRQSFTDGWRLRVKPRSLKSFLTENNMALACKVRIDRRLRNAYSSSYDEDAKSKTSTKIIILKQDGSIEDAAGPLGSWEEDRRRARRGQRG